MGSGTKKETQSLLEMTPQREEGRMSQVPLPVPSSILPVSTSVQSQPEARGKVNTLDSDENRAKEGQTMGAKR